MCDCYLLEGKLRIGMRWMRAKSTGCVREVLKVSDIDEREETIEYHDKMEVE